MSTFKAYGRKCMGKIDRDTIETQYRVNSGGENVDFLIDYKIILLTRIYT